MAAASFMVVHLIPTFVIQMLSLFRFPERFNYGHMSLIPIPMTLVPSCLSFS